MSTIEWWQDFGAALQFMPDTPALAFDMTVNGPKEDGFRYSLMYNMQNTPQGIEIYPPEGVTFPQGE